MVMDGFCDSALCSGKCVQMRIAKLHTALQCKVSVTEGNRTVGWRVAEQRDGSFAGLRHTLALWLVFTAFLHLTDCTLLLTLTADHSNKKP
jgi:hypothetical protein